MNTEAIEEVALHLPIEQRAQLAHRLLLTLDDFSEAAWREESQHRAADLNQGISSPVSSDEVSALAKSLLK
jgi:hypothetical protein